jgi:hypothetical protein
LPIEHTKALENEGAVLLAQSDRRPFWHFFDLKAYIIMACMMGGGIGLREAGVFPDVFVGFFYTGLGCALASAGISFIANFIRYENLSEKFFITSSLCGRAECLSR